MIFESKILCNIIAMRPDPGMGSAEARKTMLENVAKALPVKRVGQAEDCADQILLMLRNTFMTGSVVYVDGGGLLI